jgi:DNA-binding MarR family transcriptional regulator
MATREKTAERPDIILGLLTSVERHGSPTQRHLAAELDIALGLVNAYLKRCVKKGLVKVKDAPARRYAYYLTPKGFSEKSRLTVEYLSTSFSFFRRARQDCAAVFETARARGWKHVTLAGASDLAEICVLSALESGIEIVAIVDDKTKESSVAGIAVVDSYAASPAFDAIVITDLEASATAFASAVMTVGAGHVLAPALLKLDNTDGKSGAKAERDQRESARRGPTRRKVA